MLGSVECGLKGWEGKDNWRRGERERRDVG